MDDLSIALNNSGIKGYLGDAFLNHLCYEDIGLQFLLLFFFIKSILLRKNNAISKVLNKLQVFHFRCTVHTNTTPTVITHSCVLQKPPSCNDNGYKFEFKIVDQIGTSVRFWPKK